MMIHLYLYSPDNFPSRVRSLLKITVQQMSGDGVELFTGLARPCFLPEFVQFAFGGFFVIGRACRLKGKQLLAQIRCILSGRLRRVIFMQ